LSTFNERFDYHDPSASADLFEGEGNLKLVIDLYFAFTY
jgi:hypothetical protein